MYGELELTKESVMSNKPVSKEQKEFLLKLKNNISVSRRISNRTGQALRTKGLVRYAMMIGWVLTEAGIEACKGIPEDDHK